MNKFMRLFALLLVVVAIVLVVLAFQMGGNDEKVAQAPSRQPAAAHPSSANAKQATYAVATAATRLAPGQAITQQDVKVEQRPYKVTDGFASVEAVTGKVPAVAIDTGAVLTQHVMLDDLSLKLQPGERAVAVPVSDTSGVGHHVHAGDYVDLFFALKPRTGGSDEDWKKTQSRLLLPRLRVLAYGSRTLPQAQPARATSGDKAQSGGTNSRRFKADTVVLAVPVNKVNRILLAEHNGKLSLALRSPTDPGMPDVKRFPQPSPVLIAEAVKPNKTSDKTDPPSDPASASSADNAAYAGIHLGDLASGDPKPKRHTTRRRHHYSPPHHRVDIIRGTERSHMTVYDQGGTP